MDALLELGLSGGSRGRGNVVCRTVEELQGQLDVAFRSKCSPGRAEHMSVACEFQSSSTFMLGANNEDPSQDPVLQLQDNGTSRRVTAVEAIEKQPSDDPVLQKAIAKHITGSITAVDGASWVAREVGRASQGWTFTYICKESMQAWTRATAKTPGRLAIGEWSGSGGLDSINAVRPAFDCRGTLSIAFSKASRAIIVKYEHLPLHRTVSQLIDELAPATIPPVSAKAVAASVNKTPKAKHNPPVNGVESSRKKKKRPAPEGEDGAEPTQKKKKSRKSKVNPVGPPLDDASSTTAVVSAQAADPGPTLAAATSPPVPSFTPLNVPPAEAERRREAAVRLLSGRGIDPTTLSTEQLNIFANQAPSLQETSLEMFAMYGAERLRIVHPDDAADNASASPAPAAAAAAPNAANNIDPSLSGPQAVTDDTTSTKISIGAGAVVDVEENGAVGTTESTLKPAGTRTTRGACANCKRRKAKCTKERPECSNCVLAQGEQCFYAPVKPRRKSEKTPAGAVPDQEGPEMAVEQNGVNERSWVANPPTQSFSSINSAVEIQQQTDRLAFSQRQQQRQQQQQPPHAPIQYTTALDAVQQALGQSSQANTPTTKSSKSRRRQAPYASSPVTQTPVPPPKLADHRRSLPSGPGTRQVTNQIPNIHAMPPTRTSMVQNSPTMTTSPTTHAQQIQRPRSTSANVNPSVSQSQSAYPLPPAAASISGNQFQTSPSTTASQPVRTRTPAAITHRASPQTVYATASQTGATQPYSHTTTAASDPIQDNYQHYNNARTDAYTSSWNPQNSSSVSQNTAAYGTQQKTAKQAAPTGLSLPQYTASQTGSHSKRGSSKSAASTTQANASRGQNGSQTSNSQWTSQQPQTSQATTYNYNMPASQGASSYTVDNNMIPESDSTSSHAYGSSQPTYGNYGNQQNTSDNHTQQNWYGNLPKNNRASTYGSTSTSHNALPNYQTDTQRSGNVSGYNGHAYGQTSDQNIYNLFQSNRQH